MKFSLKTLLNALCCVFLMVGCQTNPADSEEHQKLMAEHDEMEADHEKMVADHKNQ